MNSFLIIFIIVVITIILILICTWHAQSITVSGFVYNAESHERIKSAKVVELRTKFECFTNEQGFFSIIRNKGLVEISITCNGYTPDMFHLNLKNDTSIICYLKTMTSTKN